MAISRTGLHLSPIKFRAYSEDDVTDFVAPGGASGSLNLSRLRVRAWEDNFEPSIGGSTPPGGGGGGGGGDRGIYSIHINQTANVNNYAYINFSPQTAVYVAADFYVTPAMVASFAAAGGTSRFSADFFEICANNDPTSAWYAVFVTNKNTVSTNDGNIYMDDYYGPTANRKLITPSTWYTAEIAYRLNGSNHWESNWRLNGVEAGWNDFAPFYTTNSDVAAMTTVTAGAQYPGTSGATQEYYVDNIRIAYDTWPTSGGTVVFSNGFETGDFSAWTGTTGTPTLDTPPA